MKVAVILSGCGVYDGSEIHESVLVLLALARAGVAYQCLAPNMPQAQVVDHLSGRPAAGESRNVLVESARIARGQVLDIAQARADDYAAMFFPGGSGAAKNLSDFAFQGADCQLQPDLLRFARAMAQARKPACFVCIAPVLIPRIYGPGAQLTIGQDTQTAQAVVDMGGLHHSCGVREIAVDPQHRLVSTPAYMLAHSIAEAADGIDKAVKATLAML